MNSRKYLALPLIVFTGLVSAAATGKSAEGFGGASLLWQDRFGAPQSNEVPASDALTAADGAVFVAAGIVCARFHSNGLDGGMPDIGLVAEEVASVEPLLTTTNAKGQIEGVKYDRVGVVLINAVKEQQAEIEVQARMIRAQQAQIDQLKKLVCSSKPQAEICREEKK